MIIGIIGAPNKGKSTLFSAMTMVDAKIANYPFTTVDPNKGVCYASAECAEAKIGKKCNPRNSICMNGHRFIPINVVDVAGLVPGAHEGKGMGNQFLSDLSMADAFIIVVDATGKTDQEGNSCDYSDPAEDVKMVVDELVEWISGIIERHMPSLSKRDDGIAAMCELLTGLKIGKREIEETIDKLALTSSRINWNDVGIERFSRSILMASKRFIVAANKSDAKSEKAMASLRQYCSSNSIAVVECSAAIELALRKASSSGAIRYEPGSRSFEVTGTINEEQGKALERMAAFLKNQGTNVQELINTLVFSTMHFIVVYPVEDENKFTDHYGNVLPDAVLLADGSTAQELAAAIHSEIAKNMLYAINAITKMRIGKDHKLADGDIIKIVSAAR
ncbi:YchF-related putative GTPase [Candidatus Marsarchaeota archaeon]|nr:YchF-related putative GTPase [Candidatus Marsarchaeota archaeon]MCL5404571.1 YchF-related putative GTPase [Candidatus Marsarchaeota archaeon]